jgi:ribonuclease P protein component
MLAKKNRLAKDRDFALVKKRGEFLQSSSFALIFLKTKATCPSRFGFVVSTKISKLAVGRNKVKRLLRQSITNLMPKIDQGFDCVFLVKGAIKQRTEEQIGKEVEKALQSAEILK